MKSVVFHFFLLTLIACAGASGAEPDKLAEAKKSFSSILQPTEADRQKYLTELAELRKSLASEAGNKDCFKVDAEMRRHPAPENTTGYTRLMAGTWSSPRHEYIYRPDGAWSMLPEEDGVTRGSWRIEGNRFFNKAACESEDPRAYTILLLTEDNFIFTDDETVFYEERIRDDANQESTR